MDTISCVAAEKYVQYEQVFNHFDDNGDGKLSAMELQQCICSVGGELSLQEAETTVQWLDSDGDGLLGFDDFVRFLDCGEEEEKIKVLLEAFNMYKMEGDECITPKSLKRMLSTLGESRSLDQCKRMIAHFDLNGDGVLNFDEFRVMMS